MLTVCYGKTEMPLVQERPVIIQNLHDSLVGGHKGFHQTYNRIRERYYWQGMRNQIQDFIRTCSACQEQNIHRTATRTPLLITDTPLEAFEKVSIDTVGILRTTADNCRQLLTMQCHFTKFVNAVPPRNIKATTITDALARRLVCHQKQSSVIMVGGSYR